MISRRRLFRNAACLAASPVFKASASVDNPDPFDSLPKSVWARARNNGLVMIRRPAPRVLSSRTQIVGKNEPGEPLIVEGQVYTPEGTPAAGVTVYAYNTDAEGYYGLDRKEYPPRLYGWMKTDAAGRFELRTIHPGAYPGMRVPSHIHFSLWGADYPPQWLEDLRFEGDPYLTPEMLTAASSLGEFNPIRPLTRTKDGVLHCRFQARLQRETNFR